MKPWSRALAALASLCFTAACGEDPPEDPPVEPSWQLVFSGLEAGLLRAWGTSATDVYVVGADPDLDQGPKEPLIYHYDGTRWKQLHSGVTDASIWWVVSVGPDDVRMVGDRGLVLRYTPSTGAFERRQAPTDDKLFGVWGSSSSDVWYAGSNGANRGAVFRDDGSSIVAQALPGTVTASTGCFKVHGFSPDSVWVSCQRGVTLYWNGTALEHHDTGVFLPLMGIHGTSADRMFAVGGGADGVMLSWDGNRWTEESPPAAPGMIGVWASPDQVYAVGANGNIFSRSGSTWTKLDRIGTFEDLHSVWFDEKGGIWLSGGLLASDPPARGVLGYYGPPLTSEVTP